jgi:hypothetical protein
LCGRFHWIRRTNNHEAVGSELGEAGDGDDEGEFGLGVGADDAADLRELMEDGFEELRDGHGVEFVSEGEHALVVLGEVAAAGVIVEAAEGLAAERRLSAGLSGGEAAGAEGGAGGHVAPFWAFSREL